MAKSRMINTKFWTDAYISRLDPTERLIFLYLLTNPYTNICGIYELGIRRMSFDTGIEQEKIITILDRFERDGKVLYRNEWIAIKNFIKHQVLNPKVQAGINYELVDKPKELINFINLDTKNPTKKRKRPLINKTKRKKIFERDKYKCQICGLDGSNTDQKPLPIGITLEIDHVIPFSVGGTSEESNLRVLCSKCNGERNANLRWEKDGSIKYSEPIKMGSLSHLNINSNIIKYNTLGADIIKKFEEIDPKNKKNYNNKTQRESCDFLIKEYGLEKVFKVIEVIKLKRGTPYFPSITNPYELQQKWTKVGEALLRENNNNNKTNIAL